MADLNKIVDQLSKLTVVEAAELSKQLEDKWGVTAAAPVAVAPVAAIPAEEKSEFTVFLTAIGDKKINVIKEVRKFIFRTYRRYIFRGCYYFSKNIDKIRKE